MNQPNRNAAIHAKAGPATPAAAGRCWYRIEAKAGDGEGGKPAAIEVLIYDEIGLWGIEAKHLIEAFAALDDGACPVIVCINSPGGDCFDSIALNGWVQRLGARATVRIDALAASGASVIAVGGHRVVIAESALMMIHNPRTISYGESADMRHTADWMDKARDGMLAAYRRKAPAIEDAELVRMMDEETWLTAQEAVALGLADVIEEQTAKVKACRGATGLLARYRRAPKAVLEADGAEQQGSEESQPAPAPEPEPEPQPAEQAPEPAEPTQPEPDAEARLIEQITAAALRLAAACIKAGIPETIQEILMSTKLTDNAAVEAEEKRIEAVRSLCVAARLPELAADYVKAGLSADAVRARLFDKLVDKRAAEIDNKEPAPAAGGGAPKAAKPDAKAIYAARKDAARKAQNKA
jgi:ATP-dependent protease ClpP protease subunit